MMPRTLADILAHASEIATEMHDFEPTEQNRRDPAPLLDLRRAVVARADAEKAVAKSVAAMRDAGYSWMVVGMTLGTSSEAARQRYGAASPASGPDPAKDAVTAPTESATTTTTAKKKPPAGAAARTRLAAKIARSSGSAAKAARTKRPDYGLAAKSSSTSHLNGTKKTAGATRARRGK